LYDIEYRDCQPDVTNYGALMSACGACGDAGGIRGLISDMRKRKLTPDDASYNVLIGSW
jgi:pentatricopeptide repeat protein